MCQLQQITFVTKLESNPSVPSTFHFSSVKTLYLQCTLFAISHLTIRKLFQRAENEQDWGISFLFISILFISILFISFRLTFRHPAASLGSVPGQNILFHHSGIRRHLLAQSRVRIFHFTILASLSIFGHFYDSLPNYLVELWTPMPSAEIQCR